MAIEVHSLTMNSEISHWFEQGIYPGGEPYVKFDDKMDLSGQDVLLIPRIRNMNDVAYLWQVADILKTYRKLNLHAFVPYFPGARQDRRIYGQHAAIAPFTAKMYADMLTRMPFEHIWVLDPHSDVLPAILDNATFFKSDAAIWQGFGQEMIRLYDGLIAPDAGAAKKTYELAASLGMDYIQASKHRDPKTGQLAQFSIDSLLVGDNLYYIVVDDICDGGGTFAGLAKEIHRINPDVVLDLFVTHGIFSGNAQKNLSEYRDVYATTSFQKATEFWNGIDINQVYLPIIKESIK